MTTTSNFMSTLATLASLVAFFLTGSICQICHGFSSYTFS